MEAVEKASRLSASTEQERPSGGVREAEQERRRGGRVVEADRREA